MKVELKGKKFHRWTVLREADAPQNVKDRHLIWWLCKCSCGTMRVVRGSLLSRGFTKSCGCLRCETRSNLQHGHSRVAGETKEYNAWMHAKQRCYNPKNPKYKHYGARGIKMCEKWLNDFAAFLADVGKAPDGMTLDRKDVDGHYEPGNVRWTTPLIQGRNTRRTKWYGRSL